MKLSKIITKIHKTRLTKRFLTRLVTVHGCSSWVAGFLDTQISQLETTDKITRGEARKYRQWLVEIERAGV